MVFSGNQCYLWKQDKYTDPDAKPDLSFHSADVINKYNNQENSNSNFSYRHLENIAYKWLLDLTEIDKGNLEDIEEKLDKIGFLNDVKEAVVLLEAKV